MLIQLYTMFKFLFFFNQESWEGLVHEVVNVVAMYYDSGLPCLLGFHLLSL